MGTRSQRPADPFDTLFLLTRTSPEILTIGDCNIQKSRKIPCAFPSQTPLRWLMLTSAALCQHKSRSLKTSALQPGMLGGIFHKIRSRAHSVSSILCILSQSKLSSSKGMSKQESELRYIIIPRHISLQTVAWHHTPWNLQRYVEDIRD